MATCTITITSAILNPATGDLTVSGTINSSDPCGNTASVVLSVSCGSNNYNGTGIITFFTPVFGIWNGAISNVNCDCNSPITITATGNCTSSGGFNCTTTTTFTNLCCCPKVITTLITGSCNSNNQQLYSFDTAISIGDSCTYTFRRDFGDGTYGGTYTFTGPGIFTIPTETHPYNAPATYTSNMDIISPAGCGTMTSNTFTASCGSCYPTPLLAFLCPLFELIFLISSIVGIVLMITLPCTAIWVPLGFFSAATTFSALYNLLQCDKCDCAPFQKSWGRIFLAVGIVMFMFIPIGCSAISGGAAFAIAIGFIAVGLIILWQWYNTNKNSCPLLICDFWCTIGGIMNPRSATNLAILSALIVYSTTGFVLLSGLGIAILVASIIASVANSNLNSNNPPCNNTTSICQ
jgi:hypothetical protein